MNLQNTFRFWPVSVVGLVDGWAYGTYAEAKSLGYRELIERGRLHRVRRNKGVITERQIEKSALHYDTLEVALEADRTLLETYVLDAQQFFEPSPMVSEARAREALLEFVNLEDRNEAAAVDYVNKYGEFDWTKVEIDKLVGPGVPEAIQRFCKGCIRARQLPFALSLSHFWAVRDEIDGLWNLARALDQKDSERVRAECTRRRPHSSFDPEPNWLVVGKSILCADLSAGLNPGHHNPRVFLSEKAGSLIALTMAVNVRSGLYLMLLDMIVSKTGYKSCPNCKKHFIVTVKRKKFCTEACQNAAKARRFRARHKMKMPSDQARGDKGA